MSVEEGDGESDVRDDEESYRIQACAQERRRSRQSRSAVCDGAGVVTCRIQLHGHSHKKAHTAAKNNVFGVDSHRTTLDDQPRRDQPRLRSRHDRVRHRYRNHLKKDYLTYASTASCAMKIQPDFATNRLKFTEVV